MPDLSKHLARAKQAFDKGNCDMAIEILNECVDVDPSNVEIYKLLLPVARRKAKETGGKTSFFGGLGGLSMSSDPHKRFAAAVKALGKGANPKDIVTAMEAAVKLSTTIKAMVDVAIYLGDEFRTSGLFNDKVFWWTGQMYMERYQASGKKDEAALDKAIKAMGDLEKQMPTHTEAGRTLKNWLALKSVMNRNQAGQAQDYRSQLASDVNARRQEVMNRIIRTTDDAREVLKFLDEDLAKNPADKAAWIKKGDIHRRIGEIPQARIAFDKAQQIDAHDFTVTMRLGDLRILEAQERLKALPAGSPEAAAAKRQVVELEISEFRIRVERQPTDMNHRFNLGMRLVQIADIDGATAEFQKTVNDPKLRKGSHRYLGYCFTKKNLLDLAIQQYKLFLPLIEDELSDEAKEGRFQLARLYEDRGQTAEAIAEFEKLVATDYGFKDAAARLSKLRGG